VPRHTTWNAEPSATGRLRGCSKAADQLIVKVDDKTELPNKLELQSPTADVVINDTVLKRCQGRTYHAVKLSYSGPRHPFRDPQSPVSVVSDTLGIACDQLTLDASGKVSLDQEECTYDSHTLACKHAVAAEKPKVVHCYLSDAGVIAKGCPCEKDIARTSDAARKATLLNSATAANLGCTELCRCQ
jgi:hypothetical protein